MNNFGDVNNFLSLQCFTCEVIKSHYPKDHI